MKHYKLSSVGIVLAGLYILICIVFVTMALTIGDPKSKFVLLQIPIVLQLSLFSEFGLSHILRGISWFWAYILCGVPIVIVLYGIGHLIQRSGLGSKKI